MNPQQEHTELQFPRPDEFATDERVQFVEEAGCYVFSSPKDNTKYEYDQDKGAWFPVWNESLVAEQQSAYGTAEQGAEHAEHHQRGAKRKTHDSTRKKENTSIYISGLPLDTTEEEVIEYFSQCGAIMPDILTNKPRVKLYRDRDDRIKGDALVTYYKMPSVQLAVDILDDSQFRPPEPTRISVQQAEFQAKNDGNTREEHKPDSEKHKKLRVDAKLVKKRIDQLEKKLNWTESAGEIAERHKRTVILKYMFTINELENDVTLLLDLAEDVRTECEKLGVVTSVKIYDRSEEGVIAVKFKDEAAAKACVKTMNGRFFAGRQIEAAIYDGHTRYKSSSRDRQRGGKKADDENERMEKYAQWLDSGH
ncbi:hypothetical protein BX070DRAFT_186334 [Coemansia spiralis]|nr:hypothetical protein BX070DRAFT_186334 [Coemansia spiralis]